MSKEFRCTQCRKKIITEREDRRHTDYSYGLCEECKSKPEGNYGEADITKDYWGPQITEEKPNPLACKVCGKICKTKGGLKTHKKTHKPKD